MTDIDLTLARARELEGKGLDWSHAFNLPVLEDRLRNWPNEWGDNLRILLYGDFKAPPSTVEYPSLGITVHPEKTKNTIIRGAMTVLGATVKVEEKSVPALVRAARRINLLLGTYTLHAWGNAGSGWWSWVTHGSAGGVLTEFDHEGMEGSTAAILKLPEQIRAKIEAGLYWVREPRNLLFQSYRPDVLRMYSAYWNAFECLVDAVNTVKPRQPLSNSEKQSRIDQFLRERSGKITVENLELAYRTIVNTGFRGKASHALRVCFGAEAGRYISECFELPDKRNRLYDIRNAINHGDIDAENPEELFRVEAQLRRLWMIVWRMFGRFIPFPAPAEPT